MTYEAEVAVLGGGAAGLFLTRDLARRGYQIALVSEDPVGGYSSTRNQGWLQSGALYALLEDDRAADQCRVSSHRIRTDFPDAISSSTPAYMLFEERSQLTAAQQHIRSREIYSTPLSNSQLGELRDRVPMLAESPLQFALQAPEVPINTSAVLHQVGQEAITSGAFFYPVDGLASVKIRRLSRGWRISFATGEALKAKHLVIAAGPYIPTILKTINSELASVLVPTKIAVCVLKPVAGLPMLLAPYSIRGPNIVPFGGYNGPSGISICLARDDIPCDPRGANDKELPKGIADKFSDSLNLWYPNMASLCDDQEVYANFYVCQKLRNPSNHSKEHLYHEVIEGEDRSPDRTLHVFYAGKFTSALTSAEQISTSIARHLGKPRELSSSRGVDTGSAAPLRAAVQQYFAQPTFIVERTRHGLAFRPIKESLNDEAVLTPDGGGP